MNKMEAENRGRIDDQLFLQIIERSRRAPAVQSLGIRIIYLDKGIAGMTMSVQEKFANARGVLHGGILAAFADTSMGYAIQTLGLRSTTVDMNINYIAPVGKDIDSIRAEGQVLHVGKTSIVAESALLTEDDKIIAKSRGTFFIISVS